ATATTGTTQDTRVAPGRPALRLDIPAGAPGRTRTCNHRLRRPVLYPVELRAHSRMIAARWSRMVGVEGFEPPTSCSQSRRATRLRYTPADDGQSIQAQAGHRPGGPAIVRSVPTGVNADGRGKVANGDGPCILTPAPTPPEQGIHAQRQSRTQRIHLP